MLLFRFLTLPSSCACHREGMHFTWYCRLDEANGKKRQNNPCLKWEISIESVTGFFVVFSKNV